jgi:hypothetical protein
VAVHFVATEDRLEIDQTRRGLRIGMWLCLAFAVLGFAMMHFAPTPHTTVSCTRASGRCTVTRTGHHPIDLQLAQITGARLADHELLIDGATEPLYHVCQAPRAELQTTADQLTKFFADPNATMVATSCDSTASRVPIGGQLGTVLGIALVLWYVSSLFLIETRVVIDRAANTIALRGRRGWKKWDVERSLAEVDRVRIGRRYAGRGQYLFLVFIHFGDGASYVVYSPAMARMKTFDQHVAELQRFVDRPIERMF